MSTPDYAARRWAALAVLAMTQFVVVLDITIVNIALPTIQTSLGFTAEGLPWVINAYLLVFGGFLLLGGRAADLFGRRRMFVIGLALFGLGSLLCGLAFSPSVLIGARCLQGLGGALLSPAALSLITVTFEGSERSTAMGVWSAVAGAGGATGVVLGGVLTAGPGWPWVFWVNVPVTLVCAVLTPMVVSGQRPSVQGRHFDAVGALCVTLGLALLLLGLTQLSEGDSVGTAVLVLVVAVVLLAAFVLVERRSRDPLLPMSLVRRRGPLTANVTMMLFIAGVVGMNFFVTLYLQQVLGYGPTAAGLAFLPMACGQILFSNVASRLIGRLGVPRVLTIGLVGATLGFLWFAAVSPDGTYLSDVLGPAVVLSIGGGFTIVAIVVTAVDGVPPQEAGLAGGLINMSQQIGGALGLAVLSAVATAVATPAAGAATRADLTLGYQVGFLVAAALSLLGLVYSAVMLRARTPAIPEEPTPVVGPCSPAPCPPEDARPATAASS